MDDNSPHTPDETDVIEQQHSDIADIVDRLMMLFWEMRDEQRHTQGGPVFDAIGEIEQLRDEIARLRQREEDILAGIQLVVKGSNAGRDKEIEGLRQTLDQEHELIVRLQSISSVMASMILKLPCECIEQEGVISQWCDLCSIYMEWEDVMNSAQ